MDANQRRALARQAKARLQPGGEPLPFPPVNLLTNAMAKQHMGPNDAIGEAILLLHEAVVFEYIDLKKCPREFVARLAEVLDAINAAMSEDIG